MAGLAAFFNDGRITPSSPVAALTWLDNAEMLDSANPVSYFARATFRHEGKLIGIKQADRLSLQELHASYHIGVIDVFQTICFGARLVRYGRQHLGIRSAVNSHQLPSELRWRTNPVLTRFDLHER
jgi:hypothetical protein